MKQDIQTDNLYQKIKELLQAARQSVVRTINHTMVHTYFEIGRMIVEDEQQGKERADYGKQVLKNLSQHLQKEFGKGFSVDNLQNMRQFFLTYSIYETVSRKSEDNSIPQKPSAKLQVPDFKLSWSHYLKLNSISFESDMSSLRDYVMLADIFYNHINPSDLKSGIIEIRNRSREWTKLLSWLKKSKRGL